MKKILILSLIVLVLTAGQAFGSLWTYYDFGDPFDHNNNWSPISYPWIGNVPSPGMANEGGEKFDEEGGFFAADESYLYFGITNSFGLEAYSVDNDESYSIGDLFFGFNGSNTQYAMGNFLVNQQNKRGGMQLAEVISYDLISEDTEYGDDIRNAIGAYKLADGVVLGDIDFAMTFYEGLEPNPLVPSSNGDTYLLEYRVPVSLLSLMDKGDLTMINIHQTLECGNDLIEEGFEFQIPDDIPEPTTLVLLGIGLLGAGAVRRFRK